MGAPFREIRIGSWDEFLRAITNPPYSNWAFRGERHAQWPLNTALARYFRDFQIHRDAWPEQEGRILRIFKRKAHQYLAQPPAYGDDFQWLALMQHHGAPTRLLDFTWSPYVAAFFALERAIGEAAVWALNPTELGAHEARKLPARSRHHAAGNGPADSGKLRALFPEGQPAVHLDGRAGHHEPAADRAIRHLRAARACWTCRWRRSWRGTRSRRI